MKDDGSLKQSLNEIFDVLSRAREDYTPELLPGEMGTVSFVGRGIARVKGLPGARADELVRLQGNRLGIAYNLDPEDISLVLLDKSEHVQAGDRVYRTGRVLDVPVGESLLGRVLDAMGRPLDGLGPVRAEERRAAERRAPEVMERAPVSVPLQTGLKAIDALIPIGRGQRELILGDRQVGKTAIAVDTMINQRGNDVLCVYCAIGQRNSSVARVIEDLREHEMMDSTIVVVAGAGDPAGLKFIAPYSAMTMAEYFMERGRDVLVAFDDLTRHARAYRELSLLLRRPPAREAYPGDIFYIHSRLLERATHLRKEKGGGSLTALPIVETEAQNISAYIPTNLVSITDGQIYLSPELFQQGVLPAIDVGKSVSRVGGKTQLPAYRAVAGDLRLSYSQFEELETFARFGTQLDEETRKTLERGRRAREVLKQSQYQPMAVSEQIVILLSLTRGVLDRVSTDRVGEAEMMITKIVSEDLDSVFKDIESGKPLSEDARDAIARSAANSIANMIGAEQSADSGVNKE